MMTTSTMSAAAANDADLVAETLAGNREAFDQIVTRYQFLVCSLAYSATGSLEQVLAFVEGTLEKTNPGRAFTLGVLAALPLYATSAAAASVGATAAKGSATAGILAAQDRICESAVTVSIAVPPVCSTSC